jgi:hypothetical protein
MRHFNPSEGYWGNSTKKIIGGGDYRLTARSVKIFADGALRTGGAAVSHKCPFLTKLAYDYPTHSSMNRITIIRARRDSCA